MKRMLVAEFPFTDIARIEVFEPQHNWRGNNVVPVTIDGVVVWFARTDDGIWDTVYNDTAIPAKAIVYVGNLIEVVMAGGRR